MMIDALWMIPDVHMRKSSPSRVSVPSRGFCSLAKHVLKNCPSRIGVPSKGFLFCGKVMPRKNLCLGSAILARALDVWGKACPEKAMSRVGVPSRSSSFLGSTSFYFLHFTPDDLFGSTRLSPFEHKGAMHSFSTRP